MIRVSGVNTEFNRLKAVGLKTLPKLTDALALFPVRQAAEAGLEIVRHVLGVGGRRNDRGHRRLGEYVFEEQLRPAVGVELGGPIRHRLVEHPADTVDGLEWLVTNRRDAARCSY